MKKRTVKKRALRGVVRAAPVPGPRWSVQYGRLELRFNGPPVLYGSL